MDCERAMLREARDSSRACCRFSYTKQSYHIEELPSHTYIIISSKQSYHIEELPQLRGIIRKVKVAIIRFSIFLLLPETILGIIDMLIFIMIFSLWLSVASKMLICSKIDINN